MSRLRARLGMIREGACCPYEWAWAEGPERRLVFSQARAAPSTFDSCPRDEFGATAKWA